MNHLGLWTFVTPSGRMGKVASGWPVPNRFRFPVPRIRVRGSKVPRKVDSLGGGVILFVSKAMTSSLPAYRSHTLQ